MLVSDYLDQVIKSRPYKYSTKQSLIRDVKRLRIADLDTSEITSALIRYTVDCIPNHNSRRKLYTTARSIFKDLGLLIKPRTNENLRMFANLNIDLKTKEILKVETFQNANAGGFMLFFHIPDPVAFENISSMSLETSIDVFVGIQSLSKPNPATLWYGN